MPQEEQECFLEAKFLQKLDANSQSVDLGSDWEIRGDGAPPAMYLPDTLVERLQGHRKVRSHLGR